MVCQLGEQQQFTLRLFGLISFNAPPAFLSGRDTDHQCPQTVESMYSTCCRFNRTLPCGGDDGGDLLPQRTCLRPPSDGLERKDVHPSRDDSTNIETLLDASVADSAGDGSAVSGRRARTVKRVAMPGVAGRRRTSAVALGRSTPRSSSQAEALVWCWSARCARGRNGQRCWGRFSAGMPSACIFD